MTEFTSVEDDFKIIVCKVCSPFATTECKLASTKCPYRDVNTLIGA